MNNSGKSKLPLIMAVVVAIVLVLGVFAVYEPLKTSITQNKQEDMFMRLSMGTGTVSDIADLSGMSVDELIAAYGVAEDGITGDTNKKDFENAMTFAKYCEYMGITYTDDDFAAYKAEKNLGDDVTVDTKDPEVKTGFATYMSEKQQAEEAAAEGEEAPAEVVAE